MTKTKPILLLATHNANKAREFRALLPQYELITLDQITELPEVEETGLTFRDNAVLKAEVIASYLNMPVLADDSGISVHALDGRPGIRSKRFAEGSDADRNDALLREMRSVDVRSATDTSAVALAVIGRPTLCAVGVLKGWITQAPFGRGGFGYDPIFMPIDDDGRQLNATLAQLDKTLLSARARAVHLITPAIEEVFADRLNPKDITSPSRLA